MPNYEYLCTKCGHRFEQIRKFSDKQLRKCPECGGVIEQVISAPAVQFKGSGWYVTDYAKGSSKDSGKSGNGSPAASSSSESKSSDSKGSDDSKSNSSSGAEKGSAASDQPAGNK